VRPRRHIEAPVSAITGYAGRSEIRPDVMLGKPVIRGKGIAVELVLRRISEGAWEEEILESYPRLTREDIRTAAAFAADEIAHTETIDSAPSA
jgi:uncharacterized protein (DUF433 family)